VYCASESIQFGECSVSNLQEKLLICGKKYYPKAAAINCQSFLFFSWQILIQFIILFQYLTGNVKFKRLVFFHIWLIDWLMGWLIDWLIDWLTDLLTDWLIDLTDLLTDWLIDLTDLLTDWLIDWFDWLSWLISWSLIIFFSSNHHVLSELQTVWVKDMTDLVYQVITHYFPYFTPIWITVNNKPLMIFMINKPRNPLQYTIINSTFRVQILKLCNS